MTVASRRLVDEWRSESARRRREEAVAALDVTEQAPVPSHDDTLTLLFMCCHPAISVPSQLALTLRAVGGLTTAEIANAFLVPEATMAQRISRAKQRLKTEGITFELPPEAERADRLRVVLQVLYLVFNEGYTTSSGPALVRADLTTEAIRLARMLHELVPARGRGRGPARAHAADRCQAGCPRGRGRHDRPARRSSDVSCGTPPRSPKASR